MDEISIDSFEDWLNGPDVPTGFDSIEQYNQYIDLLDSDYLDDLDL